MTALPRGMRLLLTMAIVLAGFGLTGCSSAPAPKASTKPSDYVPPTIDNAPVSTSDQFRTYFQSQTKDQGIDVSDLAVGVVGQTLPERVLVALKVDNAKAAAEKMPKLFPNATGKTTSTTNGREITTVTLPSGAISGGAAWTTVGPNMLVMAVTITSGPETATKTVQTMIETAAKMS